MPSAVALMRQIQEGLLSVDARARMLSLVSLLALPDGAQARALLSDHAAGDADANVRVLAAGALVLLEERADPNAASSIAPPKKLFLRFRELVRDPRPRVRLGALAQVLKYKGGILVELVEEAMGVEQDPEVLAAMIAVLGQRGSPAHLGAIATLLAHDDDRVVERALFAVAEIGRQAVLPLIVPLKSSDRPRVKAAAEQACERLDPTRASAVPARPQGIEVLAEKLTHADPRVRLAAVESAAQHMGDAGIEGLVEVLSELDAEPRIAEAARALLGVVEERAAAEAPTPAGAVEAIDLERSWARLPPRQLAEKRLRSRLASPDERIRLEALAHLRAHPVKALLSVVIRRLDSEDSPIVLAALLRTMGTLGSDAEVPRLAAYLSHGNPRVVRAAVIALYRLGGDEMLPMFMTLLARPDPRVQEQAVAALLRMGADKLLAYVMTMAKSTREDARSRALTLLERIETPVVEDLALDMLERELSDRLIPREMFLLARKASPRSIGLIWAIRCRRPPLSDHFTLLINKLSDRWGLTVEEITARGEVFVDEHPEMLEPPAPREAPEKKKPGRWQVSSLADDIDRRWLQLGALALFLFVGWEFDLGGFRTAMSPGGLGNDAEQKLVDEAVRISVMPSPPAPDLPELDYSNALEAVAATYITGLTPPNRDTVVSAERARLKKLGFTYEPYLDMESRGQYRGPSNRAMQDANEKVLRGDLEGALTILKEAYANTESENLLVRMDLAREIARLLVKLGRLDDGRLFALAQVEFRKKIVAIRRATTKPGGGALGSFEEEKAAERAGMDLTAAFDEAARRVMLTGSPTGLTPEEKVKAKADLEKLVKDGTIKPQRYREALAKAGLDTP